MICRLAQHASLVCAVSALGALESSCSSYNDHVKEPIRAFEAGDFERAEDLFAEGVVDNSPFLVSAEAGMSAFTAGDFEAALEHLHIAEPCSVARRSSSRC